MVLLTSNPVLQLRNNHPFIPTRVPYSPNNPWLHGSVFISPHDSNKMFYEGLLTLSSSNTYNAVGSGFEGDGTPYLYNDVNDASAGNVQEFALTGSSNNYFVTRNDPRMIVKFKLGHTTNLQLWIGFANNMNLVFLDPEGEPDPLGNAVIDPDYKAGFGLFVNEGNFKILRNNATATSTISADIDTIDTDIHTIYLESDYGNARWGYSFDNAPITYFTTKIPPGQYMLRPQMIIMNTAAETKRLYLYDLEAWMRRFPVA